MVTFLINYSFVVNLKLILYPTSLIRVQGENNYFQTRIKEVETKK
jgi:hypothetical protein